VFVAACTIPLLLLTTVLLSSKFKQAHKQLSLRLQRTLATFSLKLSASPLPTFISAGSQTRGNSVMDNTGFFSQGRIRQLDRLFVTGEAGPPD